MNLFERQIDVLKDDLANIGKMLEAEKVALPNNSLIGFLSDRPSHLQSSLVTEHAGLPNGLPNGAKSEKLTCVAPHFDKLAESYTQARMLSCFDTINNCNNGLDSWGTSLSELTEYSKFQKLKIIKCKSTVPSIDFDKNQLFLRQLS